MRSRAWALTALLIVLTGTTAVAQNGKSTTNQGSTPNGKPFRALQAQIATFQSQIDALVASNAAQDDLISALGGIVLALEAQLAGVQASIAELQTHDALYDRWIDELEGRWRTYEARLEGHENDLQTLYDADQALQRLMYALQLQANSLHDRLATLDSSQSSLESSLTNNLATTRAALADLRLDLNGMQAALTQACPTGWSIRQVTGATGEVVCEFDDIGSAVPGGSVGQLLPSDFSDEVRTIGANAAGSSSIFCPSGSVATGGGYQKGLPGQVFITSPTSSSRGSGWVVGVHNQGSDPTSIRAITRCARVVP